jgi:hypothetical protein
MPRVLISAPEMAVTEEATSFNFSDRLFAVTMTSLTAGAVCATADPAIKANALTPNAKLETDFVAMSPSVRRKRAPFMT